MRGASQAIKVQWALVCNGLFLLAIVRIHICSQSREDLPCRVKSCPLDQREANVLQRRSGKQDKPKLRSSSIRSREELHEEEEWKIKNCQRLVTRCFQSRRVCTLPRAVESRARFEVILKPRCSLLAHSTRLFLVENAKSNEKIDIENEVISLLQTSWSTHRLEADEFRELKPMSSFRKDLSLIESNMGERNFFVLLSMRLMK